VQVTVPFDELSYERCELVVGDGWDTIEYRSQIFWRVLVNGELLSEAARPFSAADEMIVLHECTLCGHCGSPGIIVRRLGDAVAWINNPGMRADTRPLAIDRAVVFEAAGYKSVLGKAALSE
jgi:hypothetical protein